MSYVITPIGYVESPLVDRASAPKQGAGAPDAWLVVAAEYAEGLRDLRVGDEVELLTWLHRADRTVLTTRPRDDPANPMTGVFSTRSPDRPNPVGLHRVRVLARQGLRVRVGPLEALDGTPVVDLKPVLREAPPGRPGGHDLERGVRDTGGVATEKGERRRAALVAAAADLLRTGGFDAVRHRAVAERAGLPLASTTYYFATLDDLVVAAMERSGRDELAGVRAALDALGAPAAPAAPDAQPPGGDAVAAVVELVLDQLLGHDSRDDPEAVVLRYERFVGAGRRPYLRPLMRAMRVEFDALLVDVLARAGVTLDPPALARLVAIVDGTVVNSLIEADPDPRAAARAVVHDLLGWAPGGRDLPRRAAT